MNDDRSAEIFRLYEMEYMAQNGRVEPPAISSERRDESGHCCPGRWVFGSSSEVSSASMKLPRVRPL